MCCVLESKLLQHVLTYPNPNASCGRLWRVQGKIIGGELNVQQRQFLRSRKPHANLGLTTKAALSLVGKLRDNSPELYL